MDKFVMKSSKTVHMLSAKKSSKQKPKGDEYDKDYDAKKIIMLKSFPSKLAK